MDILNNYLQIIFLEGWVENLPSDLKNKYAKQVKMYKAGLSFVGKGRTPAEKKMGREKIKNAMSSIKKGMAQDKMDFAKTVKSANKARRAASGQDFETARKAQEYWKQYSDKYRKREMKRKIIGGVVLATYLTVIAYSIYQSVFSPAARACATRRTPDAKSICMKEFRIKALKAEINALNSSKAKCRQSEDPEKCISKINERIEKVKKKLKRSKASLARFKKYGI